MSRKQKRIAKEKWKDLQAERDAVRKIRCIFEVPAAEVDEYTKIMSEARDRLEQQAVPAMPLVPMAVNAIGPLSAFRGDWVTLPRQH